MPQENIVNTDVNNTDNVVENNTEITTENNADNNKSRKRKRDYHLMLFIDNEKGEIQQMGIGRLFIEIVAGVLAVLLIMTTVGWCVNSSIRKRVQTENATLTEQAEQLQASVEELSATNDELSNKIVILSDTVNTKVVAETVQAKVDEEAHLPEGFPLSSSASMANDEENPNVVLFNCSSGANVISAGAGIVIEVVPNADYGNCVRVDHDNGYITEYYNSSTPVVREGDEVLEGSILYVVEEGSDKLAYKVIYEGKEIDPMSIIRIDG